MITTLSKLLIRRKLEHRYVADVIFVVLLFLKIKINDEYAISLQQIFIFGEDCFKEGSQVYIDAPAAIYINMPQTLWEGGSSVKCKYHCVGTTLGGKLSVVATVREILPDGSRMICLSNGIITRIGST